METKEILDKLNMVDLVKLNGNAMDDYLKDNISNMLYLSSYIEGNRLSMDTTMLLLNGRLMRANNKLEDYFEMVNHGDAYIKLIELGKRKIDKNDAIGLRKILFRGILGVYTEGFRRFRNDAGYLITDPVDEVPEKVNEALLLLNGERMSDLDNFINSADFHLQFSPTHPFEDGVGRTTRLLMNLNLLKNDLKPVLLEVKDVKAYNSSLSVFEFSGHKDAFYLTIFSIAAKEEKKEVVERLSKLDLSNPENLAVKSAVLQSYGKLSKEEAIDTATKLYNEGKRSKDSSLSVMGLWILSNEKLDSEIVRDAINSKNEAIRAVGLLASRESGNLEYADRYRELSLTDKSPKIRLLSIAIMADTKKLDKELIGKILSREDDEAVLIRLSKCLVSIGSKEIDIDRVKKLTSMDSPSIKKRAYAAYVAHASEKDIIRDVISPITQIPEVAIDGVINQLAKSEKINTDYISRELAEIAEKNDYVRRQLLAGLSRNDDFNKNYNRLIQKTLEGKSGFEERAYSIYLFGNKYGFKTLSENGVKLGDHQTREENIATFLIYAKDLTNNYDSDLERATSALFNLDDQKVNFVEANEISRLATENRFGSHFLLQYKKESKMWVR